MVKKWPKYWLEKNKETGSKKWTEIIGHTMGKSHSAHPILSSRCRRGGLNLQSNLQRGIGLAGPQLLEGAAGKERGLIFSGGVGGWKFYIKNELKSEIFNE